MIRKRQLGDEYHGKEVEVKEKEVICPFDRHLKS
jgi:hypothetical protein